MSDDTGDKPRLSVCIACYNQARFLDDAIDSVRLQEYPECEIIVVDDGSTDHTITWAARSDLRYVRQANGGLSSARNAGLRIARGTYVTFLDADDIYLPGAFAAAIESLESNASFAFVYGGYTLLDEKLVPLHQYTADQPGNHYVGLLNRNHIAMHGTVFYRRSAIMEAGGFDTELGACEDYDVYLRIARNSDIGVYHVPGAGYRMHASNMTRNSSLMLRSALAVMKRNKAYASLRPEWWTAYCNGISFWKSYYGERLAKDVLEAAFQGSPSSLGLLWTGMCYDLRFPRRLAGHLWRRLLAKSPE